MTEGSSNHSLSGMTEYERKRAAILFSVLHILVAYAIAFHLGRHSGSSPLLDVLVLNAFGTKGPVFLHEFAENFLLISAFLYAAFALWWVVGRAKKDILRGTGTVALASLAIALLRAGDAIRKPIKPPESLPALVYAMIIDRQEMTGVGILILVLVAYVLYAIVRRVFAVEYHGGGVRIKLPGEAIYYFPIFPQDSWQDTGIELKEHETIEVYISGRVSPGAMHIDFLSECKTHMNKFVQLQEEIEELMKPGGIPDESEKHRVAEEKWKSRWAQIDKERPKGWVYTGPEGYNSDTYKCVGEHPLYGKHTTRFYEKDRLLTVMGQPHNHVIGYVQSGNDEKPRETSGIDAGFDWAKCKNDPRFLDLSKATYPCDVQVRRTGRLWVVINDVDVARWDNTGLFLLKITKRSLF